MKREKQHSLEGQKDLLQDKRKAHILGFTKKKEKLSPVNPFNCEILPVPCPVSCWTSVIRILYSSVISKGSKERPCTLQVTRHLILGP